MLIFERFPLQNLKYLQNQNTYGHDFFCIRLRVQAYTVMNFFLHSYGFLRKSTGIYFCTVTEKLITVPVFDLFLIFYYKTTIHVKHIVKDL